MFCTCSSSEQIEKLGLFSLMNARRDSGAPLPHMDPSEKSRNYALRLELDELKHKLEKELHDLASVPWHQPSDIPLLELEEIIEVRPHSPWC